MAKKQMVPDKVWDLYKRIVNDFIDADAGKQPIIWKRYINQPLPFGEDSGEQYEDVPLDVLVGYNSFKTWPSNLATVSGELDNINAVIWVSARLLGELGYLNPQGYWDFERSYDRFILNGITYKASGDTQVSQAKDEALLFMVVLKREEENIN